MIDPAEPSEVSALGHQDTDISTDCGTMIDRLDKKLTLYPPRGLAIAGLHDRFVKVILPMASLFYLVVLGIFPALWWVLIFFTFSLLCMYISVRRTHSRTVLPVMEMRLEGIEIHSLNIDIFIPWAEIKEVRAFTLMEAHIGIVPFDLRKTLARGTVKTQIFGWTNAACVPIYKLFGIFVSPLFLLQSELPLTIDDVVEQINLRRQSALRLLEPGDKF